MSPIWKDGIKFLLKMSNLAFSSGETEIGASLLVTAILAQSETIQ